MRHRFAGKKDSWMESLTTLYKEHIATLQSRAREILQRSQLDALLIHSGELITTFLDDHSYPFKVNPQFKAWVSVTKVPNCWLWVDGVNAPKLWSIRRSTTGTA